MTVYFSSRDVKYRAPFGAVEVGSTVFFRICLPRDLKCHRAVLKVFNRFGDSTEISQNEMFWAGKRGKKNEWWEGHLEIEDIGIYNYWFYMETDFGKKMLTFRPNSTASLADWNEHAEKTCDKWQITCFEKNFTVPKWLSGGIMYQIFPDRFAFSGEQKTDVPHDRNLRSDWGEQPLWQPDGDGTVWNNDYFCGDFIGIAQKLSYLKSLGVTCIYMNPIFEAHSNHRYDTADYGKYDPLLGSEADFDSLISKAESLGIKVIIDGVFSHTGADSVYFNKNERYGRDGAYNSQQSPYYNWYKFSQWPDKYASWWGFVTLPEVNEDHPDFSNYISGADGIAASMIRKGVAGWRLDVADELPNSFLFDFNRAVKRENKEAIIIGEVWEDATTKESYDELRPYLLGSQLDSVMNYPFRDAIISFVRDKKAKYFMNKVMSVLENYPPSVVSVLMNHIGTHDTERILTLLAGEPLHGRDRGWQSRVKMSENEYNHGVKLLKLASFIQYTLPGVPCIYYGDEAGIQGYKDPFNRACFPWGNENKELTEWYTALGEFRHRFKVFKNGTFSPISARKGLVIYSREDNGESMACVINCSENTERMRIPMYANDGEIVIGDIAFEEEYAIIKPFSCSAIVLDYLN